MTSGIGAPARPRVVPPAEGELHVWIADLDVAHHALDLAHEDLDLAHHDLDGLLSPRERERAEGFVHSLDARRWGASRGLLRLLLGAYLDADPRTLGFRTGEYGKPRLAGADGRLRFNLSHSGGVAVYAVALGVEVGVDVQTRRHRPPTLAVAERAFGRAEAVRLARLAEAEREREFLRLWVCHEAGLKCLGVGLAGSEAAAPAQRPRTKEPERPWARELYLGARWSVAGAVAAVAAIEEPVSVRRRLVAHVSPIDRPPHPGDTADQA